jgi:hypothetical protein
MKFFSPQKKPSDSKTPKTNIKNQNNQKNHQQNTGKKKEKRERIRSRNLHQFDGSLGTINL